MQEQLSVRPSMGITAPPSWLFADYRPSMGITAAPVPEHSSHRHPWLLATYGPSMDVKKPVLATAKTGFRCSITKLALAEFI